ncbi:MAG: hypothetical protein QNJ82_12560 [Gammaproteobacteria bacterium]|nr:hypothetical protein [Gammaproteobacteria bacterium]
MTLDCALSPWLIGVLLVLAGSLQAQTWEGRLTDGSRVQVDPSTNRPVLRSPGGVVTPLWDGVHRLQDGRSITVREGVMVPNREVIELRRGVPPTSTQGFVVSGASPCVVLVRKVCGLDNECGDNAACGHARQLHQIGVEEERELAASGASSGFRQTPTQCAEALRDEAFFLPCQQRARGGGSTPCGQLVSKVCGSENRCAGQPACPLARQLFDLEYQDRLKSLRPEQITEAGKQCREALTDSRAFAACPR